MPLSLSDARNYLHERAASIGRTNLYSPEALDLIIDGSRALPRLLQSIAHQAYWAAASEGASQIGAQHVSNASGSQGVEPDKTHADDARRQAAHYEGGEPGAKTQFRFGAGTKENDRSVRTSERIADVSDSRASIDTANQRIAGTLSRHEYHCGRSACENRCKQRQRGCGLCRSKNRSSTEARKSRSRAWRRGAQGRGRQARGANRKNQYDCQRPNSKRVKRSGKDGTRQ